MEKYNKTIIQECTYMKCVCVCVRVLTLESNMYCTLVRMCELSTVILNNSFFQRFTCIHYTCCWHRNS